MMAIGWRLYMSSWALLGFCLVLVGAIPFFLLHLTLGWAWRPLVASADPQKLSKAESGAVVHP